MLSWLPARNGLEKTAWHAQADREAQVAALTASLADWHVEQQQGFQQYLLDADSQLVKAGESSQLALLKNVFDAYSFTDSSHPKPATDCC